MLRTAFHFVTLVVIALLLPRGACAQALPAQLMAGPEGTVAVGDDPKAIVILGHFTPPGLELIQAFVLPEDKVHLDAGEAGDGARYVFVVRFRDTSHQSITVSQFQSLIQRMRQQSLTQSDVETANTMVTKQLADLPDYKNARVDKFVSGITIFDQPGCFAQTAQSSLASSSGAIVQYMATGYYRIDGKFFMVSVYSHSDDQDVSWLLHQGSKWLRGLCAN